MVEGIERRKAYAQAIIRAGDYYRGEMHKADVESKQAMEVANQRFRERMTQALRVYDEEIKAAQVEYGKEEV